MYLPVNSTEKLAQSANRPYSEAVTHFVTIKKEIH